MDHSNNHNNLNCKIDSNPMCLSLVYTPFHFIFLLPPDTICSISHECKGDSPKN
jgi:hypothetical protein